LKKAIAYVNDLDRQGKNYSAGLMQINSKNFTSYGVNNETVFDLCSNIKAGAKILTENYIRQGGDDEQINLRKALSRYYSGNDKRGFTKEFNVDGKSYVERVEQKVYKVPALLPSNVVPALSPLGDNKDNSNDEQVFVKSETDTKTVSTWDVFGDYHEK